MKTEKLFSRLSMVYSLKNTNKIIIIYNAQEDKYTYKWIGKFIDYMQMSIYNKFRATKSR